MEAMLPYLRTHLDVVDDTTQQGVQHLADGETGALKNKFQAL